MLSDWAKNVQFDWPWMDDLSRQAQTLHLTGGIWQFCCYSHDFHPEFDIFYQKCGIRLLPVSRQQCCDEQRFQLNFQTCLTNVLLTFLLLKNKKEEAKSAHFRGRRYTPVITKSKITIFTLQRSSTGLSHGQEAVKHLLNYLWRFGLQIFVLSRWEKL